MLNVILFSLSFILIYKTSLLHYLTSFQNLVTKGQLNIIDIIICTCGSPILIKLKYLN